MKYFVLYNPLAGNGKCAFAVNQINLPEGCEIIYRKMTEIENYQSFFKSINREDKVVICGGDGTLNRFVNSVNIDETYNEILYFAAGSGNDFLNDLNLKQGNKLLPVKEHLKNLPTVLLNGKSYKFINGIGFGIDGYCCVEGDRIRRVKKSNKPINYTPIALKGLLYDYTPTNATVTVDGKKFTYKKVWLAPTMKGRFFGGGMMIAPQQNRKEESGQLTLVVGHNLSKLKIISLFPLIFKGKHIKHTKNVAIHKGYDISVEFDRPTDLQIDGEAFSDILHYEVSAKKPALQTE